VTHGDPLQRRQAAEGRARIKQREERERKGTTTKEMKRRDEETKKKKKRRRKREDKRERKAFRNGVQCRTQIISPKRGSVIFYKVIEVAR